MRRSVLRWLLRRGKPKIAPLYQRTSWYDFEGRMHRAIALDMAIELGEITRAEVVARQITRPLLSVDPAAPTEQAPASQHWFYNDATIASGIVDEHATRAMEPSLK